MSGIDALFGSDQPKSGDAGPNSGSSKRWLLIAAVGVAVVLVLALVVHWAINRTPDDFPGPGTGSVSVIVQPGMSLTAIGQVLTDNGVIASSGAFVDAAATDPRAGAIGPGTYSLAKKMSAAQAIGAMVDPSSRTGNRIVLPEGLRLTQTVAKAANQSRLPVAQFVTALSQPASLGLPVWAKDRPEGFMYPASYDLTGSETGMSLVRSFVSRFNTSAADLDLVRRATRLGQRPYAVLTVASLLQAEGSPNDYSKIARVIYNRLAKGMHLELDTTVAYGLGITKLQLTAAQLASNTPYNTYKISGLPPTPINSPGAAAIEAALNPAKGKWLYFVTTNLQTRETKFARTYKEFLVYKAQMQAYLSAHATG